jgi:hypothetical protein
MRFEKLFELLTAAAAIIRAGKFPLTEKDFLFYFFIKRI